MDIAFSLEDESFKLCIDENKTKHNFVPKTRKTELTVLQNSFAAFQAVILSDTPACVNLGTDPWFSEIENTCNLRLAAIGDLPVRMFHIDMHRDDTPFYYGDALLRQDVVRIIPEIPHSIYVEIPIDKSVQPGKYEGKIRMYYSELFDSEEIISELSYTINVLPLSLPDPSKRKFQLDLWQHNSNIARKAETKLWSDEHFLIIEKYIKTLAELGQRAVTVVASEIPWCGQRCFLMRESPSNLFEYSMIKVTQNDDKSFTYDYSAMDRYIELCFSYGIDREIEVFGLLNNWQSVSDGYYNFTDYRDIIRVRYEKQDGSFGYMHKVKHIESYIKCLYKHFEELGVLEKVRITADEPVELENFELSFKRLSELAPGFKYKCAIGKFDFYRNFSDKITDFVPSMLCFFNEYKDFANAVRTDEREFLWYICCSPEAPNTYLHSNLLETRYIAALTHYCGLSGLLRWNYTVWPNDPRRDIRYSMFAAGDTNFVYPAGDMSPLLSLRYKMLLRASEEFELLETVKENGDEETLEKYYDLIIPNRRFDSFFDNNVNNVSFCNMTTLKCADWEKARIMLYKSILRSE